MYGELAIMPFPNKECSPVVPGTKIIIILNFLLESPIGFNKNYCGEICFKMTMHVGFLIYNPEITPVLLNLPLLGKRRPVQTFTV